MFARASLCTPALAIVAALALSACSSSSDDSSPSTTDSGSRDSSTGTDGGTDSSGDGLALDTRTTDAPKSESSTDAKDGGGPTLTNCDPHTGDECNMVKQDCAGADQTCDFDTTKGHAACGTPPIGVVGKGEACDASNPCDRGLFCYDNKCSPPCCPTDNSVCGGEGMCNLSITQPVDGGADEVLYHVCTYPASCHAFKYDCPTNQVCLFSTEPDTFACATPTSAAVYKAGPGPACVYANDCGESQLCTSLTSGGGDGGSDAPPPSQCYLFCYLSGPEAGSVGTTPDGRFAANGTCTVGGTSYGTCTSITGIGGGLGLCVK